MLKNQSIVKQTIGSSIYLGGKLDEIESLNFSLYNFNQNFNSDLIELSDVFFYFVTTEKDYIKARSRNMHFNVGINFEGADNGYTKTRQVRRICENKARAELAAIPEESFIHNNQEYSTRFYDFGAMPVDLNKLGEESYQEIQVKNEDLEEKKETIV